MKKSFGAKTLIEKLRPFVYSPEAQRYHGIGLFVGKAFEVGRS